MNGDPIDPVTFHRAVQELWEKLAAHAGFDLRKHQIAGGDLRSPEQEAEWRNVETQLQALRGEADNRVLGLIICEHLRSWTADGERWRRLTLPALKQLIMDPPLDEIWPVYVDRQELAIVAAAHWPEEFAAGQSSAPDSKTAHNKREVGRPRGPGYNLKDVPVFELILEAQRQSGDAESQHRLVTKFADQAEGASLQANVDRLRRGLPRWLEENGLEWRRSN